MKSYLLRDIPDDLWVRVKRRAAREGRNIRYVILRLIGFYADKGLPKDD